MCDCGFSVGNQVDSSVCESGSSWNHDHNFMFDWCFFVGSPIDILCEKIHENYSLVFIVLLSFSITFILRFRSRQGSTQRGNYLTVA